MSMLPAPPLPLSPSTACAPARFARAAFRRPCWSPRGKRETRGGRGVAEHVRRQSVMPRSFRLARAMIRRYGAVVAAQLGRSRLCDTNATVSENGWLSRWERVGSLLRLGVVERAETVPFPFFVEALKVYGSGSLTRDVEPA